LLGSKRHLGKKLAVVIVNPTNIKKKEGVKTRLVSTKESILRGVSNLFDIIYTMGGQINHGQA